MGNIKPKFKEGDIIFTNGIDECKVIKVLEDAYEITNDEIENDANQVSWIIKFEDQDNWEVKIGHKFKEGDIIRNIGSKIIRTVLSLTDSLYYFKPCGWELVKNQDEWELIGHEKGTKKAYQIKVGDRIRVKGTNVKGAVVKRIYKENDIDMIEFDNDSNSDDQPVYGVEWEIVEDSKPSFDDHIQEGDNVIYSEELGCRVNLSQLGRVSISGQLHMKR